MGEASWPGTQHRTRNCCSHSGTNRVPHRPSGLHWYVRITFGRFALLIVRGLHVFLQPKILSVISAVFCVLVTHVVLCTGPSSCLHQFNAQVSSWHHFIGRETKAQGLEEIDQIWQRGDMSEVGFHSGQPDSARPQIASPHTPPFSSFAPLSTPRS